ncbi:MAG: AraC family transcriptional regulator, partial [Lachnospiraceae bacterium]|nr:AraC family transcriptional regulator [Lachnospiraceae bacterium]
NATGNSSRDSVLDDILYYIDHNYQNNIKLESIAPLFGYNSAYLGKIFNKAIGESFNSYIDHRRIEHSKELLSENRLKVYEIAEQVGYKNVDYFHKKFKKYVNMSPAEFRKNITGKYPPPVDV